MAEWGYRASTPVVPGGVSGYASGSIGSKFYVCTGADFLEWDQATDTWSALTPPPVALGVSGMAGGAIGTKFYVAGGLPAVGSTRVDALQEWDQATDTWSAKASMPEGRSHGAVAVIGTKLYYAGGEVASEGPNQTRKQLWAWDQGTNSWSTLADVPGVTGGIRAHHMASVATKLYLVGGAGEDFFPLENLVIFNPAAGSWSTSSAIPTTEYWVNPSLVERDGKLYAVGGSDATSLALETVWLWDPAAPGWVAGDPLPVGSGRSAGAIARIDDDQEHIYLAGGGGPSGLVTLTFLEYPYSAGGIMVWDGSAWVEVPLLTWDGSAWVPVSLAALVASGWQVP